MFEANFRRTPSTRKAMGGSEISGVRPPHRTRAIGEPELVLHGLRKAAGVKLAESGASVQMIMSVLGHRSPRMALYYCEQANKRELSDEAMRLWERAA